MRGPALVATACFKYVPNPAQHFESACDFDAELMRCGLASFVFVHRRLKRRSLGLELRFVRSGGISERNGAFRAGDPPETVDFGKWLFLDKILIL